MRRFPPPRTVGPHPERPAWAGDDGRLLSAVRSWGFWLGNIGLLHSALAGTDGRWRFAFEANDLAIDLASLAAGAGEGVMDAATSIDAVVGRLDFGLGLAAARTRRNDDGECKSSHGKGSFCLDIDEPSGTEIIGVTANAQRGMTTSWWRD
jgi:hypothetical protein